MNVLLYIIHLILFLVVCAKLYPEMKVWYNKDDEPSKLLLLSGLLLMCTAPWVVLESLLCMVFMAPLMIAYSLMGGLYFVCKAVLGIESLEERIMGWYK